MAEDSSTPDEVYVVEIEVWDYDEYYNHYGPIPDFDDEDELDL